MGLSHTRLRALQNAHVCAALGARVRTIALVTGLSAALVSRSVFDAQNPPPRGRPPYWDELPFRSPQRVRAQLAAFAAKFRFLRISGFDAVDSLIAAYKHYLSLVDAPAFCFDEAFFVAAQLEGAWGQPKPALCLAECTRCGRFSLACIGETRSDGCAFCQRLIQGIPALHSSRAPNSRSNHAGGGQTSDISVLMLHRDLEDAGAHPRVISALLSHYAPHSSRSNLRAPRSLIVLGRPLKLERWGLTLSTAHRAQYSMVAGMFRRMCTAGFPAHTALIAAHRQVQRLLPPGAFLPVERCIEVVSLLDALWGVSEPALDLVDCHECDALYLRSRLDPRRAQCPFCTLRRYPPAPHIGDRQAAPLQLTAH